LTQTSVNQRLKQRYFRRHSPFSTSQADPSSSSNNTCPKAVTVARQIQKLSTGETKVTQEV
jgi:hypothetical protein